MNGTLDVAIVGGGLAGLSCARRLREGGISCLVLEASNGVGGRVRTDEIDGFLLDRGFQVLLAAYPEARSVLDYAALDLRPFASGAIIRAGGRFHRMIDPWRAPAWWLSALVSGVGTFGDKMKLARLRARLLRSSLDQIFAGPDRTTLEALRAAGFSTRMIDRFFRPFFAGILLDPSLGASSRMFEFVFKMVARGEVCVPAKGMGAIPGQIAAGLPAGSIRLGARAASLREGVVTLKGGEEIHARAVVLATEGPEAARLAGALSPPRSRGVTCLHFAADEPPIPDPILVLNGEGVGPVNNLAVMSNVAPTYAPAGAALVSISVMGVGDPGDDHLAAAVLEQVGGWFGPRVRSWRLLRIDRIRHAQPEQLPGALEPPGRSVRLRPALYVCGDWRDNASINGAMVSGRRAAEAVIADLAN